MLDRTLADFTTIILPQQVSDGGVHAHINHLKALLKVAKDSGVPKAYVHFFGDGRDTDPKSGLGHLKDLLAYMKEINYGQVATLVGRYYAMDRDKRWERIQVAVDALVQGKGESSDDPVKTVEERYNNGETDEFLKVGPSSNQAGSMSPFNSFTHAD